MLKKKKDRNKKKSQIERKTKKIYYKTIKERKDTQEKKNPNGTTDKKTKK